MAHHAEVYAQEGSAHADTTSPETPPEAPARREPARSEPGAPSFLLMTGASVLALVFGMIGACLALNLFENSSQAASPGERKAAAAPRPNRDADVKALKAQMVALTDRVDDLKRRIEALPKPEPSSGVAILQGQVADLTKAAREAAPLPSQIQRVQEQLAKLSEDILALRHEIGDVHLRLGKHDSATVVLPPAIAAPESARPESPAPPTSPPVAEAPPNDTLSASPEDDEPLWKRAVGLYKKGRYKDALASFNKLELSRPDDARVWYYAALCRGFTTNQWTDGTEDLAERGVDREQAGTPSADEIDRTFGELTSATGKDWLAAYRARVKKE